MANEEEQDSIEAGLDRALKRIEIMKQEMEEGEGARLFEPLRSYLIRIVNTLQEHHRLLVLLDSRIEEEEESQP